MSDWPVSLGTYAPHTMVHTYGPWTGGALSQSTAAIVPGGNVWPAANRALLVPIRLSAPFRAVRGFWFNGSVVNGTVDCGVYTPDGTLLASTGPQTQTGTTAAQGAAFAAAVTLAPGCFYLALLSTSGTGQFAGSALSVIWETITGVVQNAVGSGTLPATLSFSAPASIYYPFIGITSGSTP